LLHCRFSLPERADIDRLAAWAAYLCQEMPWCHASHPVTSVRAHAWLRAIADIAAGLAQAVSLPLFARWEIASLAPEPSVEPEAGSWLAVMAVPVAGIGTYRQAKALLKLAFDTATWLDGQATLAPDNGPDRQRLHGWLQPELIALAAAFPGQGSSTRQLLRTAYRQQIPFMHLGNGVYQLGWGANHRKIDRSLTDADPLLAARLTFDKQVTTALLRAAGLPASRHIPVRSLAEAGRAAETIGWPVVVKPADADRGQGVALDVTANGLAAAFSAAQSSSPSNTVLIEAQVPGHCHRLFIAGGKLLYAVKRLPNGVFGNGTDHISALVEQARQKADGRLPWEQDVLPSLDASALAELQHQGLGAMDVPAAGQFVALRRTETMEGGSVSVDVTDVIHPDNIAIAQASARLTGLNIAGVDLISTDISKPWYETGAIINEINYAPSLGASTISRSVIPEYLQRLLGGDGRIPIHVFVGGDAAADAAAAQADHWRSLGLQAAVTDHTATHGSNGDPVHLACAGLHDRVVSLIHSSWVEALAIVVTTDELVDTGLPVEGVDHVAVLGEVVCIGRPDAAAARRARLHALLMNWSWPRR
jgi:D-alanine-D-alanine ligase-like ATP-grasp enzyme